MVVHVGRTLHQHMSRFRDSISGPRRVEATFTFDLNPLAHQMITNVFLPMAKRNIKSGRRRHGKIKQLRDMRRCLEKKMIRSGNLRAAWVRPTRGT